MFNLVVINLQKQYVWPCIFKCVAEREKVQYSTTPKSVRRTQLPSLTFPNITDKSWTRSHLLFLHVTLLITVCMSCLLLPKNLSGYVSVIDGLLLTAFVMVLNPRAWDLGGFLFCPSVQCQRRAENGIMCANLEMRVLNDSFGHAKKSPVLIKEQRSQIRKEGSSKQTEMPHLP